VKEAEGGWGVLVAGGLGVLAVVGFVALLVFGLRSEGDDDDRVRLVAGPVVLVNRCLDERVLSVTVRSDPGPVQGVLRGEGSIERRYPLARPVRGRVEVEVLVERNGRDHRLRTTVDADHLPPDPGEVRGTPGPCPSTRVGPSGPVSALLVAGGVAVVAGYGAMIARFVRR
jgi:hypothetical protein